MTRLPNSFLLPSVSSGLLGSVSRQVMFAAEHESSPATYSQAHIPAPPASPAPLPSAPAHRERLSPGWTASAFLLACSPFRIVFGDGLLMTSALQFAVQLLTALPSTGRKSLESGTARARCC